MKILLRGILISCCLILVFNVSGNAQFTFDPSDKIEPQLLDEMKTKDSAESIIIGVWLRQEYNPNLDNLEFRKSERGKSRDGTEDRLKQMIKTSEKPFIDWADSHGASIVYQCRYAPLVFIETVNKGILDIAKRDDVDRLYQSITNKPLMDRAIKSARADVVWARGLNGSGLTDEPIGVIEVPENVTDNRGISFSNHYLNHITNHDSFDPTTHKSGHATAVAGMIAAATDGTYGNHGRYRGVAYGLDNLIDGCARSGYDYAVIEATEWARDQGAYIYNLSLGRDTDLLLQAEDRYYDYLTRYGWSPVIVAAGNDAGGYGTETGNVNSPGLAYNVITVGSFNPKQNVNWSDDVMSYFSSYLPNDAEHNREKPELVAAGESWFHQLHRLNYLSVTLGEPGTSFAAPIVTGAVGLIIERQPDLIYYPAAVKAIVMASACHNIEGDARLSELDGVGALVVCEADEIAVNEQYFYEILEEDDFTAKGYYSYSVNLKADRETRIVLCWYSDPSAQFIYGYSTYLDPTILRDDTRPFGDPNSKDDWFLRPNTGSPLTYKVNGNEDNWVITNPDLTEDASVGDQYLLFQYFDDPLKANLDLKIRDNTAGTYVATSNSTGNNYEVVLFTPANTGEYEIRIFKTAWAGTYEEIGIAWAQAPCCSPDWGDAPDNMADCENETFKGDFPTLAESDGAMAEQYEIEWLGGPYTLFPDASWEIDAYVHPYEMEKDQDGISNINPDMCLANYDRHDDGVQIPLYYWGNKGRVSFWVNSAMPNIGRYSEDVSEAVCDLLRVSAWFDWDRDYEWEWHEQYKWYGGPGMTGKAFDAFCLEGWGLWPDDQNSQKVTLEFDIPPDIPAGPLWARFHLSYADIYATFSPEGSSGYGEIEDHVAYYGLAGLGVIIDAPVDELILPGHMTDFSISMVDDELYWKDVTSMAGYDLLIAYPADAVTPINVEPGDFLEECDWEYFTYRLGPQGNCGDGCPSGMLRIVALAETPDGAHHPTCLLPGDTVKIELAKMTFLIANDRTLSGQFLPIQFYWNDCGDNSFSNSGGDTLFINAAVYDYSHNLIWNELDDSTYPEINRMMHVGASDDCLNSDPNKPSPVRLLSFINGGIYITPDTAIDDRGDINLNGVSNEIADAIVFTNYFIYGFSAFVVNVEGQIAATDVNGDGVSLTVADLTYLIRVITGDALPIPKLAPYAQSASSGMLVNHSAVAVSTDSESDIGSCYFVINYSGYELGEPHLINGASDMTLVYHDDGSVLKVLIYSMEKGRNIPAGPENIFAFPITGDGEINLSEVQLSDYNGNMLKSTINGQPLLPKKFALHQNYPNPFNATTQIMYELPEAAHVCIEVINIMGQKVATLIDGEESTGIHHVEWNGTDQTGNEVASGIYFYRFETEQYIETRKMTLLK